MHTGDTVLVLAAGVLLFVTAWIVLPGWTYSLLALSVGATEYCAWLLVCSLAVGALAAALASSRFAWPIVAVASLSAVLALLPLVQVRATIRRFDSEMQRAFGMDFLAGRLDSDRLRMRAHPILASDLFRGIDVGQTVGKTIVLRDIEFAAPEGQRLTLTIYRPVRDGPFPTVVQIYGGAWQRGTPDDNPTVARYLAAKGYVIFAIDYRHAPRWPWPAQRTDVRAALDWIGVHGEGYGADVSRVALLGRSAGAHLALLAAYEPGALPVAGVVSLYGPVDLADGYRHPPRPDPLDVRAIDIALLSGTPDAVPERYQDASPISYVTRPLPPTLLIYGARDHIVEARFGRLLHERLLATRTQAALLEIPWAEHAFDAVPNGPSGQMALYYTERFLAGVLNEK